MLYLNNTVYSTQFWKFVLFSPVQKIFPDGVQDVVPYGYAMVEFVLKSGEWTRRGGCKRDTISMTVNGTNVLGPQSSVNVCQALKMTDKYYNWRTHKKGDHQVYDTDGPRVHFFDYLMDPEQGCPMVDLEVNEGQRLNFVIRLKGSGDGKAPTVIYIGKRSVSAQGNFC
jgi:hypothetical protein